MIRRIRDFLRLGLAVVPLSAVLASDPRTIPLWPEGVPDARADATPEVVEDSRVSNVHVPTLTVFAPPADRANGTAVIVCPGGGYTRLVMGNEGHPIAQWLNSLGVTAFVLKYRLKEYGHPAPLRDALRAVRLVRSRAAEFGVDPARIGIYGASAGGHLASSAITLFDHPDGRTGHALDAVSARPDFALLQYPVIFMEGPHVHAGSRRSLLGQDLAPELVARLSTDRQVTAATPPTFLVHAAEDTSVPLENSVAFHAALRRAGAPAELHVFQKGAHGFGLRKDLGPASEWPRLAEAWMRVNGWLGR
jgi:acetyl esterase/lipase